MAFKEGELQVIRPFPTYVCAYQWPDVEDFNRDLSAELYRYRAHDPDGIYRSNMAGTWHSKDTVLSKCGEPGKELGRKFFQLFSSLADCHGGKKGWRYNMNMVAWAMMYRDRGYSTPHTHPNCHFSGVYYVTGAENLPDKVMATGVKIRSGSIEFLDIRGGPGSQQIPGLNMNPSLRIPPHPGLMLVFPSWLPHFVHPVEGDEERIAISANASVTKYYEAEKKPEEAKTEEKDKPDDAN